MRYDALLLGPRTPDSRASRYGRLVDAIDELTELHNLREDLSSTPNLHYPVAVLFHYDLEMAIQMHWVIGCLVHWPELRPLIEEEMAKARPFAGTAGLARLRALRAGQKAISDNPLAHSVWTAKCAYRGIPAAPADSIADAALFITTLTNRFA